MLGEARALGSALETEAGKRWDLGMVGGPKKGGTTRIEGVRRNGSL